MKSLISILSTTLAMSIMSPALAHIPYKIDLRAVTKSELAPFIPADENYVEHTKQDQVVFLITRDKSSKPISKSSTGNVNIYIINLDTKKVFQFYRPDGSIYKSFGPYTPHSLRLYSLTHI